MPYDMSDDIEHRDRDESGIFGVCTNTKYRKRRLLFVLVMVIRTGYAISRSDLPTGSENVLLQNLRYHQRSKHIAGDTSTPNTGTNVIQMIIVATS